MGSCVSQKTKTDVPDDAQPLLQSQRDGNQNTNYSSSSLNEMQLPSPSETDIHSRNTNNCIVIPLSRIGCRGDIYLLHFEEAFMCYGVLRGSLLTCYAKNNINNLNNNLIPFDCINLNNYYEISESSEPPIMNITCYRLTLYAIDHMVSFMFMEEKSVELWLRVMMIALSHAKIPKIRDLLSSQVENTDIVQTGRTLMNCKEYLYIQLNRRNNAIYCYENYIDVQLNKYKIDMIIDLNYYKYIKCYDNLTELVESKENGLENKNDDFVKKVNLLQLFGFSKIQSLNALQQTNGNLYGSVQSLMYSQTQNISLFKYGFILHSGTESEDILCLFKSNNERYEWLTHLQFMLNVKVDYVSNISPYNYQQNQIQYEEKQNDDDNEYNKSLNVLLSSLKQYEICTNNENKQQLNINYLDLVNAFHKKILYDQINNNNNNNIKDEIDSCTQNGCQYIQRHQGNINNHKNDMLSELLDTIHCYLYHQIKTPNINNKYIINTEQIINNDIKDNDDNKGKDNTKKQHNNLQFAFGGNFSYYHHEDCRGSDNFVSPYYHNLFDELSSNPYYKIDKEKLYQFYTRAIYLKQSEIFKNKTAESGTRNHKWSGIAKSEKITINHIISLLIYCNETEIQQEYKKHTRKLYQNETFHDVLKRQSYIAHWTRYLKESCFFYGEELESDETVYCGLDRKLLFDTFNVSNYSPLSTSTDLSVAYNFATAEGIILKLQSDDTVLCKYFDMMAISNYVNEKERFFCGTAKFKIVDIIFDGVSNKDKMLSFQLLQLILSGSLFYYDFNKHIFDDKIQNILINYLANFANDDNKNDYFQQILNSFISSYISRNSDFDDPTFQKLIYLNLWQLDNLKDDLKKDFFCLKENNESNESNDIGKGILFLSNQFINNQIQIGLMDNSNIIKFIINKEEINNFTKGDKRCILGEILVDNKYTFLVYASMTNESGFVGIFIESLNSMDSPSSFIGALIDIVCPEIKYQNLNSYQLFGKLGNQQINYSLRLCLFSKIHHLDMLTLDLSIKICHVGVNR